MPKTTRLTTRRAWALENARRQTLTLATDVANEQRCRQSSPGEHHPAWVLGHLLLGDVYLLHLLEGGTLAEDFPALLERYGTGATPTADAARYHDQDASIDRLVETGARRAGIVRVLSAADLACPTQDPFLARSQPTIGHHLQVLLFHEGYHAGQLSAWGHRLGLPAARWVVAPPNS